MEKVVSRGILWKMQDTRGVDGQIHHQRYGERALDMDMEYHRNNLDAAAKNEDLPEHMTSLEILKRAPKMAREEVKLTQEFFKCKQDTCHAMGFSFLEGYCDKCYVTGVRTNRVTKLPSHTNETPAMLTRATPGNSNDKRGTQTLKREGPRLGSYGDYVDFDQELPSMYRLAIFNDQTYSQPTDKCEWESYLCSAPHCNNAKSQGTNEMCRTCSEEKSRKSIQEFTGPVALPAVTEMVETSPKAQCSMSWCENLVCAESDTLCQECFDVLRDHRKGKPKPYAKQIGVGNRSGPVLTSGSIDYVDSMYIAQSRFGSIYCDERGYTERSLEIRRSQFHCDKPTCPSIYNTISQSQSTQRRLKTETGEVVLVEYDPYAEDPSNQRYFTERSAFFYTGQSELPLQKSSAREFSHQKKHHTRMHHANKVSQNLEGNGAWGNASPTEYAVDEGMNAEESGVYAKLNKEMERNAKLSSATCKRPGCTNFGNSRCHGYCNSCFKAVQ